MLLVIVLHGSPEVEYNIQKMFKVLAAGGVDRPGRPGGPGGQQQHQAAEQLSHAVNWKSIKNGDPSGQSIKIGESSDSLISVVTLVCSGVIFSENPVRDVGVLVR